MNHLSKSAFLSGLARTTGWTVTAQGMLRDDRGRCPIVAVAEEIFFEQADGPTCYRRVADAIGLEVAVAEEIVFAADHHEPHLPIRDVLLDACRVPERVTALAAHASQWWWDQPMSVRARWAAFQEAQASLPFGQAAAEVSPASDSEDTAAEVEVAEVVAA